MKILDKIKNRIRVHRDPINKKKRREGQIFTIVTGACATLLSSGIIKDPIAITAITVIGGASGILAGHRAVKTL